MLSYELIVYKLRIIFSGGKSILKFFIVILVIIFGTSSLHAAVSDHFVSTWKTDNPGTSNTTSITIPTAGLGYSYQVDWNNDGDFLDADESTLYTGSVTHDFGVAGTYTIRISGRFPRIYFNNRGDKEKILSIDQWGTLAWKSMGRAFYGAKNLQILATDIPDFSATTDMQYMFNGATRANPDTTHWDTSSVTNMRYMFARTTRADPNTTFWDTSQVTNMSYMFYLAKTANPQTVNWNTSRVTTMRSMFRGALLATPDTTSWDTSSVTDMALMFRDTPLADPDTRHWDLSQVRDLSYMFYKAAVAKPDTSSWDTTSVTDMRYLFSWATAAPNTTNWKTHNVTKMQYMFYKATAANPNTTGWNIANVTDMRAMFTDVKLSTPNYDAMLQAFDDQMVQHGVTFHGGNSTYCSSEHARDDLMSTYGWSITDGGRDCRPITPTQAPDLQNSSDTGDSDSDNNTSDETPVIDLECLRIGNTLTLYSNNPQERTIIATYPCNLLGTISIESQRLALGAHTITYTDANTTHESLFSPELNVMIINDPPIATDNNYTLQEDTPLSANVLHDGVPDSDIDGDGLHVISYSSPQHGTLSTDSNGTFTYTPDTNFYGNDTFYYRISDGNGGEAGALVTLTISPHNDAPVISEGDILDISVHEDTSFYTQLHANDIDADPLHWSILEDAGHGRVSIERIGNTPTLTYTPQPNYFGSDHFELRVSDGNSSDTLTLAVQIAPINDLPIAIDDTAELYDNDTVMLDVLHNDYDDDYDILYLERVSTPVYGHAAVVGNVIAYTAPRHVNVTDTFTYTINDRHGGSSTASISITVTTRDNDGIDEPAGLDNNHNGKEDRFESHVTTQMLGNNQITLATQSSATIHNMIVETEPVTTRLADHSKIVLPFGTLSFNVTDIGDGGSAQLTLYYPKNEKIEGYAKRLNDGSWHRLESRVTHTTTQTLIHFSITDGSRFDLDTIRGQITDPGGAYYTLASPIAVPLSPISSVMIALLFLFSSISLLLTTRKKQR